MKRTLALMLVCALLLPVTASAKNDRELQSMLQKASSFMAQEDYASAEICYDIALKLNDGNAGVLSAMAELYLKTQEYDKALNAAEQAIALSPLDAALYMLKADILLALAQPDEAARALRYAEICGAAPDEARMLSIAAACEQTGFYAQAISLFERVPAERLSDEAARSFGRALVRTGAREKASALGLLRPGVKDAALAEAMQSARSIHLEAEKWDVSQCPVYCSDAFVQAYPDKLPTYAALTPSADGLRRLLGDSLSDAGATEAPRLLSCSPTKNIMLLLVQDLLVLYRNNELTVVMPSPTRGVKDTDAFIYFSFRDKIEPDNIAWSPDERYFTLAFPKWAQKTGQFLDLMIVDTITGDLFLADSTPDRISQCGQYAVSARFDDTGSTVYFTTYGRFENDAPFGLKRYDIAANTVEVLCTLFDVRPNIFGLYSDAAGSLCCLLQGKGNAPAQGMWRLGQTDGEWTAASTMLPTFITPAWMQHAPDSGLSLLANDCNAPGAYISVLRDATFTDDAAHAVMLPAVPTGTAQRVSIDQALLDGLAGTPEDSETETPRVLSSTWKYVFDSVLSPDGYYALLITGREAPERLELLDLQSLAVCGVSLPSTVDLLYSPTWPTAQFQWLPDGRVLLPTSDGGVLCNLRIG